MILAASSPFFESILRRNKHPHPLIYLRGFKTENLRAILDFLYFGEANVFQENLDSFLAVAEELRLKGLSGESKGKESIEENNQQPINKQTKQVRKPSNQAFVSPSKESKPELDNFYRKDTVAEVNTAVYVKLENLDEQINSMIKDTDKVDATNRKIVVCTVCGNEGQRAFVVRHIEAKHITGVSHACDICGKAARSRHALKKHKSTNHK